jgi:hypothetical protein
MNVAGHLAFAFLAAEPLQARRPAELRPTRNLTLDLYVMFGALIPDIIDKPLRLVGFTPHGRSIGHAILVWSLFTCLALLTTTLYPRTRPLALLAYGWATHFVADTLDDFVAGLESTGYLWTSWAGWPWLTADDSWWQLFQPWRHDLITSLEIAVILVTLVRFLAYSTRAPHLRTIDV